MTSRSHHVVADPMSCAGEFLKGPVTPEGAPRPEGKPLQEGGRCELNRRRSSGAFAWRS
jgi:hypothetical protein